MSETSSMTDSDKSIFKFAKEGDFKSINHLLTIEKVNATCFNEDGVTPLHLASYFGHYDTCKLLVDFGANVNATRHKSAYSPLMFAALGGELKIVSLLLEHGASSMQKNSIDKTPAQMAAFVGQHEVVKLINNFISFEEMEELVTHIRGLENMCVPIHKMAVMVNMHPVCLVLYIQENLYILEKAREVCEVFKILSEKKFKLEGNELISLKFHHIAYIIKVCQDFMTESKFDTSRVPDSVKQDPKKALSLLIKYWIKGDKKGFPTVLEKLLRQDAAEYPFKESNLFKDLIHTLAPVKIGDEPSVIWIISEITNEQRGLDKSTPCSTCGESPAVKKCSSCKSVYYCNAVCQKLHWFTHKTICPELFQKYKEKETE